MASERPDLREVLKPEGTPYADGSYVRVLCPLHNDVNKASGSVYEDHFFCHTCGGWENRWDFLRRIERGDVVPAAVIGNYDERDVYLPPTLGHEYAMVLQGPRAGRKEWFYERGLTDDSIASATLGHTGRAFTIPIYGRREDAESELVAIKYRSDPEFDTCADECTCPKYWGVRGHNRGLLYAPTGVLQDGVRTGLERSSGLVLTEGELDTLLLVQHGIPAVSSINGARDLAAFDNLRGRSVVIAYDADDPGQHGAVRARDYIGPGARIVTWHAPVGPDGKVHPKDVTEFIQQRGIAAFRRLARV